MFFPSLIRDLDPFQKLAFFFSLSLSNSKLFNFLYLNLLVETSDFCFKSLSISVSLSFSPPHYITQQSQASPTAQSNTHDLTLTLALPICLLRSLFLSHHLLLIKNLPTTTIRRPHQITPFTLFFIFLILSLFFPLRYSVRVFSSALWFNSVGN